MSKQELREVFGFRGHRVVLYADKDCNIEPDDLLWHEIPIDTSVFRFDEWRPIAVVICHESDKAYRQNLHATLLNPDAMESEIIWLDKEWLAENTETLQKRLT